MTRTQVVLADTDTLLEAAFRFRYRIYVELMQRRQLYADHERRLIQEPQDESARIFIALRDGEVVGTVRGNLASDASMAYYRRIYCLDKFSFDDPSRVQITTKLMIEPTLERTGLAPRLISAYALDGYQRGIAVDMIDCNRPLISFFERMGYFSYCGWRFHKEFGTVRPMFLPLDTVNRLRDIGSFLYPVAASAMRDGQYNGYELIRRYASVPTTVVETRSWAIQPEPA